MSELRPFREVQLQWLSQLVQDQDLSPRAVQIAAYIVLEHYNHKVGKAWPSFNRISKALGVTKKTVQRAISELNGKWFEITRGNGLTHSTEYVPTKQTHATAQRLRETQEAGKRDNIVTLRKKYRGQICPERRTELSDKGGQNCPPNKKKEQKEKLMPREDGDGAVNMRQHFVPSGICFVRDWNDRLEEHRLARLDRLLPEETHEGRRGYWLPALVPADRASDLWVAQLSAVKKSAASAFDARLSAVAALR